MTHHYSPHTGEHIVTDDPADWMGSTDVAPPPYDAAAAGCFWRGTAWEIVVPTPEAAPVPAVISMRQARLVLLGAGLLDAVNVGIQGMPQAAQIEWEFASEVRRDNALIATLAMTQGLDGAALDSLFTLGATL
ncbi:hypothetical protein [Rhodoferax sp.]|uniref:hypothetical protein n=1 Tax=Rhodoferax sp. TaxID=50421 RepID=UPI002ACD85DA|nr:hypothetical protein [Rhodoferax sp.]MDZ7918523.1 hypothetical protein [Rhodoferax sp.]